VPFQAGGTDDILHRRREFITLLGGAAATWPLAARAQQGERMRSIGVLMGIAADDAAGQARLAAFLQGLAQLGWIDGRNVRIDFRWGGGDAERNRGLAAELVGLAPDVIMAHSSAAVAPLLQQTRNIPIVFTVVADAVGAGYVDSLARPGGNATGYINFGYSIGGLICKQAKLGLFARACARHGVLVVGARLSAIGRQKHARATSQPFRRAAGVLRPVRALTTKTP
jgi:ABC transporter substrate binding protein